MRPSRTALLLASALACSAARADELPCPEGTTPRQARTEDGAVAWCARPDGTWHGPHRRWYPDGTLAAEGSYANGRPDGSWTIYQTSGRMARTGRMEQGVPAGRWRTWGRYGRALAGVTYTALEWVDDEPAPPPLEDPDPRLLWRRPLGSRLHALGAAQDLVVAVRIGSVDAVDPVDGRLVWRLPFAWQPVGPLVSGDGLVAWVDSGGAIDVVDLEQGVHARVALQRPLLGLVGVVGDIAVVNVEDGETTGYDLRTGDRRWRWEIRNFGQTPLLLGDHAIFGRDGQVVAVGIDDGRTRWRSATQGLVVQLAESADPDRLYAVDDAGWLTALRASDGRVGWTKPLAQPGTPLRVIGDDGDELRVLVGEQELVLDPLLGSRRGDGRHLVTRKEAGSPACAPDTAGRLACREPEGGSWSVPEPRVSHDPVLVGDRLVFASVSGDLVAVDRGLGRALAGLPWSGTTATTVGLTLDAEPTPLGHLGRPARGLLVDHTRAGPVEGCRTRVGVLSLAGVETAPGPAEEGARVPIVIPELEVSWASAEADWAFAPEWEPRLLDSRWEVSYFYAWTPRLLALQPFQDDDRVEAGLDALADCEVEAVEYGGAVEVFDGTFRRRFEGRVRVETFPHEVDGVSGCLFDVLVNEEPIGLYAGERLPGWMDLHVAVLQVREEDRPPELPPVDEPGPPLGTLAGTVEIETLGIGAAERSAVAHEPPVQLELVDDRFLVWSKGALAETLPAKDLVYELDEHGSPLVVWNQSWRLVGDRLPAAELPFLPVWSVSACEEGSGPDGAPPAAGAWR